MPVLKKSAKAGNPQIRRSHFAGAALIVALGCGLHHDAAAADDAEPKLEADAKLHDPLADNAKSGDATAQSLVKAIAAYDVAGIESAIQTFEKRAGTAEAHADDDYFHAQARLSRLQIKRFYETDLKDGMPKSLESIELDPYADATLVIAQRYAAAHPDHSDVQRVIGELYSAKIRGMTGGMTYGPKARDAIHAALAKDPGNSIAWVCQGRMHYHNPSFAGGDKVLALVEFRKVAESTNDLRAHLYMARIYRDREMYTQARFFAKKALKAAPDNPEAKMLLEDAAAHEKQGKANG